MPGARNNFIGAALLSIVAGSLISAAATVEFEAASVKPSTNRANGNFTEIAPGGQRFTATNTPLKLLIMTAYDVNVRQILGGPAWLTSEFYDVQAKAEQPTTPAQIHLMLQDLLADRFKLRLHKETRELPIYILTAQKLHPNLRRHLSAGEPHIRRGIGGQTIFENVPIAQLTWFLSLRLERDVVDKTELTGSYDFELAWTPDLPSRGDGAENTPIPDPTAPSIVTALREQLGLKLTVRKGPVRVLVIDSVEKLSAN
jgi:uncharacterized protein (TIGR03435 family)